MAKTTLNSILHEREHYCVRVHPIAFLLERNECNNAIRWTRANNNARERECNVEFDMVLAML